MYMYIYAVNKKGESKASHGRKWRFFSNVLNTRLLLHLVQKAKFLCSNNVRAILRSRGFFCTGKHAQKPKFGNFFSEKKLHKALRSVQFLASFISFYFEILSYLACGEKIIRLASKNSVKWDEKSASDF